MNVSCSCALPLQSPVMSIGRGQTVKKERGIDLGLAPCSKGEYTAAGYWLLQSPSIITFFFLIASHPLSFSHMSSTFISWLNMITDCATVNMKNKFCISYTGAKIQASWGRLLSDSFNRVECLITSYCKHKVHVYSINTLDEPAPSVIPTVWWESTNSLLQSYVICASCG